MLLRDAEKAPKINNLTIQARIAKLVAYRLGTGEVPGSNLAASKIKMEDGEYDCNVPKI